MGRSGGLWVGVMGYGSEWWVMGEGGGRSGGLGLWRGWGVNFLPRWKGFSTGRTDCGDLLESGQLGRSFS